MRLATLRVTIPMDDAVQVADVQTKLRDMLRGMTREVVTRAEKSGQADMERDVGTIFWEAADVKRGPATKAEKASNEAAQG